MENDASKVSGLQETVNKHQENKMPLEKLKCAHCKTVFYGVKDRDTHCHICNTIIMFRKFFGLRDIKIDEIDFNRVRKPKFEEWSEDINEKDWRNYIPEGLKKMWLHIPMEAAVIAIMFAEREARKEEP